MVADVDSEEPAVSLTETGVEASSAPPHGRRPSVVESADEVVAGEKLAAHVARQIEATIIERGWPIGTVLGSESELRERYGVSRSILREAVRLTEHHQVTRMRRGPGGGLVVVAPDASPAMHALVIYLEYVGLSLTDLGQARLLLEPMASAAAARLVGEEEVSRLRRHLDEEVERRDEPGLHMADRLHVMLGEMSGNPVLELFIDVLTRLTADQAYSTRRLTKAEITQGKVISHERHEEIVGAIIAGDADRAAAETAAHLETTARWLEEHQRPNRRNRINRAPVASAGAKLAETVAAQITAEIIRRDWPIGLVLGSEADLIARYGVSRSVLREAVRLLEHHSIARMRRGPGGGLIVTEPEYDASVNAIALYLDFRGVGPSHLRDVRDAIELGALQQVLARRGDPEVAERLEAAIARTREPTTPGRYSADDFHTELVDLCGNPVLAMFLRILTELWTRHTSGNPSPEPGPDALAAVETAHSRILAAILDGDENLARHRMRRHLAALTAWYDE
jgi:DNA-binding FadR family transcriptional regulator